MPVRVGWTATRYGVTKEQLWNAIAYIRQLSNSTGELVELHHGDCVGGDAQLHRAMLAWNANILAHIYIHPPENTKFRAFCKGPMSFVTVLPAKPYLPRNRDIVDSTAYMMAGPQRRVPVSVGKGGTWGTIRYALERGREEGSTLEIFYP